MKKILLTSMAMVLMITLVACGSVSNDLDTSSAETSGAKTAADLTVAGIIHVESYAGTMQQQGMKAACDEYGVKFVSTNYNGDVQKETEALNTYVAQGVDGVVSFLSETTMDLYKQASEKGVMVSAINGVANADFMASFITYDQAELGAGSADWAVEFAKKELDSSPKVHVIRIKKGTAADARGNAFMEVLGKAFGEEYGKPVSESSTYVTAEAMQQTTDAITANPDINIIYCEGEDALMGAYAAIANAGLAGKVYLFGVDGNEQLASYLLDEKDVILQGTAAQDHFEMAYIGTKNLIQTLLGEREPSKGKTDFLTPLSLNKGDLETVQKYYDALKKASGQ